MKISFVMSVAGQASPGIIKAMAEATRNLDGEWSTSKVMMLEGQFTAMMKVVVSLEKEASLKAELRNRFPSLQLTFAPVAPEDQAPTRSLGLVIDCADRPGLTKDIDAMLNNLGFGVEQMDCNRVFVSSIGEAVFTAKVSLAVPEAADTDTIVDEIEAFSEDVRVSVA